MLNGTSVMTKIHGRVSNPHSAADNTWGPFHKESGIVLGEIQKIKASLKLGQVTRPNPR